jgi:hypothetical protein
MSDINMELKNILKMDEENVAISLEFFHQAGIAPLLEDMLSIFNGLRDDIQSNVASSRSPFIRRADRTLTMSSDTLLRIYMLESAWQQFVFASSHFYRAQASEVYGHVRRAIEASGIAHLSKSKVDLGEIFAGNDENKLRNRTRTNTILPPDQDLTRDLNNMIREASSQVHNNYKSFAKRIEAKLRDEGAKGTFSYRSHIHDADNGLQYYWAVAHFMLRAAYLVAQLLAVSFDLPERSWRQKLDKFRDDIESLNVRLNELFKAES